MAPMFPLREPGDANLHFATGRTGNEIGFSYKPFSLVSLHIGGILGNKKFRIADTMVVGMDPQKESIPLYGEIGLGLNTSISDNQHVGLAISGGSGKHTLYTDIWSGGIYQLTIARFHRFSVMPYTTIFWENTELSIALRLVFLDFYSITLPQKSMNIPTLPGDIFLEPSLMITPGLHGFRFLLYSGMAFPLLMKNNYSYLSYTFGIGFIYLFGASYRELHKFNE